MKRIIQCLLIISVLFLFACKQRTKYETVTRVLPDGSCYREFTGNVDSAFMVGKMEKGNPFPVFIDSTWNVMWSYSSPTEKRIYSNKWPLKQWEWNKDTSKHLTLEVKVRKTFPSAEAMSKTFRFNHSNWDSIVPKASLEKHFKWFFTFYKFKEVFPKYDKLKEFPIDSFLKKDEVLLYTSDNPKFSPEMNGKEIRELLNDIEERKELWLEFNYFGAYYKIVQEDFPFTRNIPIDTVLSAAKDSIYKGNFDRDPRYFLNCINQYFKKKEFSECKDTSELMMKLNMFKGEFERPFSEDIYYNLIMPGKVVETNAKLTHGDTLRWKVDAYRFYFNDYEIKAESRVTNVWAFLVSGLFVLGVALSFFIKRKG